MTFAETVKALPDVVELRRLCDFLVALDSEFAFGEWFLTKNFNGLGSDRFFWDNGSGDEASVVFKADGVNDDSVLAFVFEHESEFSAYNGDFEQIVFDGVPSSFDHLIENVDLMNDEPMVYATTAAWLLTGDSVWKFNHVFAAMFDDAEYPLNGFDPEGNIFFNVPDVEHVSEMHYVTDRYDFSQEEFTRRIGAFFNEHGF